MCEDPNSRNVTDITSNFFTYNSSPSQMTVQVRAYPSLVGHTEHYTQTNSSLLSRCVTDNTSRPCHTLSNHCPSWPQSCLDFLPSYKPKVCPPPTYDQPTNLRGWVSTNSETDSINLHLSWDPPNMNYEPFPLPTVYYQGLIEPPKAARGHVRHV